MKLVILFSDTLQNTLILTMRTLWATITENAGPEMLAWDSWNMMLILGVLCSGTLRTVCQGLSPPSLGMKVLCLSTAKIIQIFFSTCVDLNVVFCPSVVQRLRSSHTGMESGIYKMRYAVTKKSQFQVTLSFFIKATLIANPFVREWVLLDLKGNSTLFSWKGQTSKLKNQTFDLTRSENWVVLCKVLLKMFYSSCHSIAFSQLTTEGKN